MNIGIIGLGQAGSSVADIWATYNKNVCCINTSLNDNDKVKNIKNKYIICDGKHGGMAKQREKILNVIKSDQENILKFLSEFISNNNLDGIILISSTAGGTGSGLISQLSRIFNNKIKIRTILITPNFTDCKNSLENTINTIMELQQYNISIRIISNQNYSKNDNIVKKYNDINNYIVDTENKIINAGNDNSLGENLDNAEVGKLLFTAGFSPVYRVLDDITDINNKIIEKIQNGLDLPLSSDKAIDSIGFIIYSDIENSKKLNEKELEDKIGVPNSRFRCILTPKNGQKKEFIIILAGCTLSDYLKQYNEELKYLNESIKNRKPLILDVEKKEEEKFIFKLSEEKGKINNEENIIVTDWLNNLSF